MEEDVTVMMNTSVESLPISMSKKQLFKIENENDQAMVSLKKVIKDENKNDVSDDIRTYCPIRNDIHEIEGLLTMGNKLFENHFGETC